MSGAIRTAGLRKTYGRTVALDDLDLEVGVGEVHGFLGPNGAGKSTTLRILLGLARADAGTVEVLGADPWRDGPRLHRRLAYVPGDVSLWPNLSGGEAIDLLARLRGHGGTTAFQRERARLLDVFELDPRKKGRSYSKGNRQKVALVAAFACPAALLVLDEPTSGLDPLMEVVFQRELHRVREHGTTVLLSSHILSEVEQVCDRVSIIRAGKVVETGTLDDLRHLTRTQISFADPGAELALPSRYDIERRDGRVRFTVDTAEVASVLPDLGAAHVTGLRIEPASLEELFLRHYGERVEDERR
jgi:ABC-2 type transport system ATP-binding protein